MKKFLSLATLFFLVVSSCAWSGVPEVIGNYNNGCINNSVAASFKSPYYQIYRPQSRRYFGDPSMIAFLDRLSKRAHNIGFKSMLVGDISSQYGGPLNTGHASHQIGLDVDIEFNHNRLTDKQLRGGGQAHILVDKGARHANSKFTKAYYDLIMAAAHDPDVERIFVSPAIKITMCDMTKNEDEQPFLRKIRPWYGHTEHFHVRLRCPIHSPLCQKQEPPSPMHSIADEKEEALSWYKPAPVNAPTSGVKHTKPPFPQKCKDLYDSLNLKYRK